MADNFVNMGNKPINRTGNEKIKYKKLSMKRNMYIFNTQYKLRIAVHNSINEMNIVENEDWNLFRNRGDCTCL